MKTIQYPDFLIEVSPISGESFYTDDTLTRAYVSETNPEFPENDSRHFILQQMTEEQLQEHFDD